MLKKEQFLVGITTTDRRGGIWREKIKEIKKLGLRKVAIFPTCLGKTEKQEMYRLLTEAGIKEIPFVHIRTDMKLKELDYLVDNFKTKAFNIHPEKLHPMLHDYSKYKDIIYVENVWPLFKEEEAKNLAGICLDISHLENDKRLNPEIFGKIVKMLKKYPVGCNHISAITETAVFDEDDNKDIFAVHYFEDLSEFDYLKSYPKKYFSNFIAMELENSLKEQLKAIDYILNL